MTVKFRWGVRIGTTLDG